MLRLGPRGNCRSAHQQRRPSQTPPDERRESNRTFHQLLLSCYSCRCSVKSSSTPSAPGADAWSLHVTSIRQPRSAKGDRAAPRCRQSQIGRRAASIRRQSGEVEVGVESQQRKLESVLPALLAMTGACVASPRRQDRLHIQFEAHLLRRIGVWTGGQRSPRKEQCAHQGESSRHSGGRSERRERSPILTDSPGKFPPDLRTEFPVSPRWRKSLARISQRSVGL